MDHAFTVGVEEEFQIVAPVTWELRSHVSELLASSAPAFGDHIKREMHQSIVEVGTKICGSIEELATEIIRTRRDLADAAERVGLRIAAAGTHPFSNWMCGDSDVCSCERDFAAPSPVVHAPVARRLLPSVQICDTSRIPEGATPKRPGPGG